MKALMVGLGGIGQRHLRNLHKLAGETLEVLAYRVRRQTDVLTDQLQIQAGDNLEEKYNIRTFGDLEQALAQKPNIALVCNPSSLHIPVALAAAKAGCHLLLEKPLSHNLEQTEELAGLLDAKGLVGLVAYQLRYHPCVKRIHELLAAKAIGRIISVQAEVGEYLPAWHPYEDYRQMYASRKELGGGVILSQIHEMDYLYSMFGLPGRIFALGGHLSSLEIDVEDTASILMECHVDGQRIPVQLHQDYVQRPPNRRLQIVGDTGRINVNFRIPSIQIFDAKGESVEENEYRNFERNQLFLDEMSHFLACVEGREKPKVTIRDGAQSLRMALAAKESLETGNIVDLK